jgi:hypothetical protein
MLTWSLPFAVACSAARPAMPAEGAPGVVVPMHLGEGHGGGALADALPSASSSTAAAPGAAPASGVPASPARFTSDPPDPTPLRQAEQYEYVFRYEKGSVSLESVRAVRYRQPVVTARRMGRFAVELWIGHELIDRVRFDFPLLADDQPPQSTHPLYERPTKMAGPFTALVVVPAASRARAARLVDRATRQEGALSWPPAPNAMGPMTSMPVADAAASEPNGSVAAPSGSVAAPSGSVAAPSGSVAAPSGSVRAP